MDRVYRLTFLLPGLMALAVPPGRHQPCIHGVVLTVDSCGLVALTGPSRESLFEQTRRFLKVAAKGHGPLSIAAVLTSPPESVRMSGAGQYPWQIIVGADVAFAPTGMAADLGTADRPSAPLQLVAR